MNIQSIILLSIMIGLATWAVIHIIRKRRKGGCAGCNCHCPLKQP